MHFCQTPYHLTKISFRCTHVIYEKAPKNIDRVYASILKLLIQSVHKLESDCWYNAMDYYSKFSSHVRWETRHLLLKLLNVVPKIFSRPQKAESLFDLLVENAFRCNFLAMVTSQIRQTLIWINYDCFWMSTIIISYYKVPYLIFVNFGAPPH